MVEADPNVALAVEGIDTREYGDYLADRQVSITSLLTMQEDYPAKKFMLDQAVKAEKDATDVLRSAALLTTVTENLTVACHNALPIHLRQNLSAAQQHFFYTKSKRLHDFCIFI